MAQQRRVRDLVFETFANEGRAPSPAEVARKLALDVAAAHRALVDLAEDHALVLTSDRDAIRMAHPFSAAPMAFVVTPRDGHDDRRWWGGCAWDSFGISAALKLDVRVDTACPSCGQDIIFDTGPEVAPPAELVVRFPRPARQWWDDVVATCSMIRAFCRREHAERWAGQQPEDAGRVAEATTVWRLAQPWYGDRLDPAYQPHTREHNQQLLEAAGLTGDFWRLP